MPKKNLQIIISIVSFLLIWDSRYFSSHCVIQSSGKGKKDIWIEILFRFWKKTFFSDFSFVDTTRWWRHQMRDINKLGPIMPFETFFVRLRTNEYENCLFSNNSNNEENVYTSPKTLDKYSMSMRVCVCVWVSEREREKRVSVYVCLWEREIERECVFSCVRYREKEEKRVSVCVCVW